MRIERICPDEAEALYRCMKQIDKESQFMLYLPDERNFNQEKLGFKIEGIKRQSIFMDEHYFDELYMAKLLNEGIDGDNGIVW